MDERVQMWLGVEVVRKGQMNSKLKTSASFAKNFCRKKTLRQINSIMKALEKFKMQETHLVKKLK